MGKKCKARCQADNFKTLVQEKTDSSLMVYILLKKFQVKNFNEQTTIYFAKFCTLQHLDVDLIRL
jgi:hypothetical protein